ncbi:MAG: hypothetical protein LAT64_09830 [Phycisphaerales bacterium]|nr:hypothetical protein [Planctomycetota bacterium]MCH8509048.1 hypothetical protein [Phycisphaerales bacterium]
MTNRKRTGSDLSRYDELLRGTRPAADARLIRDILDARDPGPLEEQDPSADAAEDPPVVHVRPNGSLDKDAVNKRHK